MYRIRRRPPPLSVTLPPPSSTIVGPVAFRIFAVACIVMVTGSGPQENVMTPPAATAATTAAEVQLAGVPFPITRVGAEVSTARASSGTAARPFGLPAAGKAGAVDVVGDGETGAADDTLGEADPERLAAGAADQTPLVSVPPPHADAAPTVRAVRTRPTATKTARRGAPPRRLFDTDRCYEPPTIRARSQPSSSRPPGLADARTNLPDTRYERGRNLTVRRLRCVGVGSAPPRP